MGTFVGPKVYLIDELLKNLLCMNAHLRLRSSWCRTHMTSTQIILTHSEVLNLVYYINNLGWDLLSQLANEYYTREKEDNSRPSFQFLPVKKPEEHKQMPQVCFSSCHVTVSKADLWGQNPVVIYSCTYFLKSKPVLTAAELDSGIYVAANSMVTWHTRANRPTPPAPVRSLLWKGAKGGGKGQPSKAGSNFLSQAWAYQLNYSKKQEDSQPSMESICTDQFIGFTIFPSLLFLS